MGLGYRYGGGPGFRNRLRWFSPGYTGRPWPYAASQWTSAENEIDLLREEIGVLENSLKNAQHRLNELEKKPESSEQN